jgi:superoxide reductase
MASLGERLQQADWKKEKHVPVIEAPVTAVAGEAFVVAVSVGKEIAHPNTTEHHISWIALYFQGEGDKFPYQVGRFEFTAHGESAAGPNQGPVYTQPATTAPVKLTKSGTFYAVAMCNIHGLWESTQEIKVA